MDTVVAHVLAYAESQPDALALIAGDRRLTYGELCRPIRAAAAWLHGRGARAGDVVALAVDASPHVVRSVRMPAGFFSVPEIIRSADGKILRGRMVEVYGIKAR